MEDLRGCNSAERSNSTGTMAPAVLDDTKRSLFTESPKRSRLCSNLVFEVLLLLPWKSLCRLRLVCRAWSATIGGPIFNLKYMDKMMKSKSSTVAGGRNHRQQGIIICTTNYYAEPRVSLDYFHVDGGVTVLENRWKQPREAHGLPWYTRVSNSCHGMLCVFATDGRIQMWNPLTQEQVHLPLVSGRTDHVGLGFCMSTVEYKMVRLQLTAKGRYSCDVLTLGSRPCKRLAGGTVPYCSVSYDRPVYMTEDGSLYWNLNLVDKTSPAIALSFDLDREEFELIMHPEFREYSLAEDRTRFLAESGGRLCFAECKREDMQMRVWAMEDRRKLAWTKMLNIDLRRFMESWSTWAGHVGLVAILGGDFVFSFKNCLFRYDPDHKKLRRLLTRVDCGQYGVVRFIPHVESLISPSQLLDVSLPSYA